MRTVHCTKLKKESEGLAQPPFAGPLGEKVFAEISKEAWQNWLGIQTNLINEKQLRVFDPKVQAWLKEQMQAYFFEDQTIQAEGFSEPESKK